MRKTGFSPAFLTSLPALPAIPVIDVGLGAILLDAVALLDLAFQLVALAGDLVEIVIGKLAQCSLILPLTCFQFPSTRFQSMGVSPFMVWTGNDGTGELFPRMAALDKRRQGYPTPHMSGACDGVAFQYTQIALHN